MSEIQPLRHGGIYHVYNRGVNRENLFKEERNYDHFLYLMKRHILPVADIYAYCLLRNHFHALLRIRTRSEIRRSAPDRLWDAAPARHLGNCFNAYAKAINSAYNRTGCLFERPFKRKAVETPDYFRRLVVYIHLNPEKHQLVNHFADWPHSSFQRFMSPRDGVIQISTVVSSFGGTAEFTGAHVELAAADTEPSFGDFN